jgi:trimeric autotransporter adhesin
MAGESGAIRIGTAGQQKTTFIAGIWGSRVHKGAEVVVNADGQLGIEESSERHKTDITPMGERSEGIRQLRPVTYHIKTDSAGELQYGLIAEEVDRVYPELVVRDASGMIEGVRYDRLTPILLNEVQQQGQLVSRQNEALATQAQQLRDQQTLMAAQTEQLEALKEQFSQLQELDRKMQPALSQLQANEVRVAAR